MYNRERLNVCKKCGSKYLTTINVINPDTTESNMNVIMKCDDCGDESLYEVASYYHIKQVKNHHRI